MPVVTALLPLLLSSCASRPSVSSNVNSTTQETMDLFRFDRLEDLSSYNPGGKNAPKLELTQSQSLTAALRATFKNSGEAWDAQIGRPTIASIKRDEAVQMSFSARTTGTAALFAVFEQTAEPNGKVIFQPVGSDGQWRDFQITRQVRRDYAAGEATVKFFFTGDGTAEISNVAVRNLGAIAGPFGMDDKLGAIKRVRDEARLKEARENIERIRKGKLTITLVDGNGKPMANTSVRVKLDRHAFRWGTAVVADLINSESKEAEKYREIIAREFNTAVFENDMKWRNDRIGLDAALKATEWLSKHSIEVRGHNLVWGADRWLPDGIKNAPKDQKWPLVEKHVREYASAARGKVYVWDVVNEAVTNTSLWEEIGWDKFAEVYKIARQADPDALLAYNDYNIQRPEHRKQAIALVKRLQAAGAPVDIFGDQGHYGMPEPSAQTIWESWDEIAKETGLPIEITEYDFGTFDEAMYAEQIEDTLTLAFGHPSVKAFLMWGFWENRHWRAAEGGHLVRKDFSYRPAMQKFHDLVHGAWSTDATLTTDASGTVSLPAFYGTYSVSAGPKKTEVVHPIGSTTSVKVTLK